MRIVYLGVAHWHTRLYMDPVLGMTDMTIVGVSDPDPQVAEANGAKAKCPHWTDFRAMCEATKPDFAFVLGRHSDMAEMAQFLIDSRIPFAIEKPAGASAQQVQALADSAKAAGVFASVAFVLRNSPMLEAMRKALNGDDILYASFQFFAGLATRYHKSGPWMLKRETAAGGAVLNLGIHFFDFYAVLMNGRPVDVHAAAISNALSNYDIEDHGTIDLRSGDSTCMIQTGYVVPAPNGIFDMHFSIRARRHYFIAKDAKTFEIWNDGEVCETLNIPTTNVPCYPIYTRDVLERVRDGKPPIADLFDGARAVALIEKAYRLSPITVKPTP